MAVFDATQSLIDEFLRLLTGSYAQGFGSSQVDQVYVGIVEAAARMAAETIATSDAPYHDVEHTMLVTLVGQEIFRGKRMSGGAATSRDWAHFTLALLCHDIGYVRGTCPGDDGDVAVTDAQGGTVTIPPGATDAYLTPYHVERGKMFVASRFGDVPELDAAQIQHSIENTRFPVPVDSDSRVTADWAGLVRAADLIGQMADPDYLRKLPALFYEFEETGANGRMGNMSHADLRTTYPNFFWNQVRDLIDDGMKYLRLTHEGRQWLASLHSHVFYQEHREQL